MGYSPTKQTWYDMIRRCRDSPYYAGRVFVCERWLDYGNFLSDMGERPMGLEIERVDNDGNYEPDNCCWATRKEQARNTRKNLMVQCRGREISLAEACELLALPYVRTYKRLARGWTFEEARAAGNASEHSLEFMGEKLSLAEICRRTGVNYSRAYARIFQLGWKVDEAVSDLKDRRYHE